MTDDLTDRIHAAAEALRQIGAQAVYLFGSAAHGEPGKARDIDLAVEGLPPERFFKAMDRAARILRCRFDLVDLDEDNAFTRYLKDEGELVRVE